MHLLVYEVLVPECHQAQGRILGGAEEQCRPISECHCDELPDQRQHPKIQVF